MISLSYLVSLSLVCCELVCCEARLLKAWINLSGRLVPEIARHCRDGINLGRSQLMTGFDKCFHRSAGMLQERATEGFICDEAANQDFYASL
jgi:hypothetical protein